MAEYFADLLEQNQGYNSASYTLFGYLMLVADEGVPDKQLFPHSRADLKGWSSRFPQGSRTGADPQIWFLISKVMSQSSPPLAAAVLLQLDSYARPSEILQLRKRDVVKPVGRCNKWGLIFGISTWDERTKTGAQDDTVFLDSVHDYAPKVLRLLFSACSKENDCLFPGCTLGAYEDCMKQAVTFLGLARFALTPHAIRHSGPSVDFLNHTRSPEEILARGRWQTLRSIQRYRKPGQMVAKMNRIPPQIWIDAKTALPTTLTVLKQFYGGR